MGEIVEIAIVGQSGETLLERKIKPQHIETATQEALDINGYNADVWGKTGVFFGEIAEEVFGLLENATIIGHRVAFDVGFIKYELGRAGIRQDLRWLSYNTVDTATLIWHHLNRVLERNSLAAACKHLGISNDGAHTALADARRAREVYNILTSWVQPREWTGVKLQGSVKETVACAFQENADALAQRERHQDLVRAFQRDYQGKGAFKGLAGENTLRALLVANGQCLAKDLRKGFRFSYPGSFKTYEAQSDAMPDERIEGKVILPVTDHGMRDGMLTRLDAHLVCTIHERPIWITTKEKENHE